MIYLVALGIALIVAGIAAIYWPAGLIAAGVAALTVAYVARYMEVRSEDSRTSG